MTLKDTLLHDAAKVIRDLIERREPHTDPAELVRQIAENLDLPELKV